jgi:hypothetical protein
MNHWFWPALLFFGCTGVAALILFFQLVDLCDRIQERWLKEKEKDKP